MASGPVRFRKHHRPCGQPAVEGGIESFRPLPEQAGHFTRIKAMPSDFPLTSTDWAMYPVPPQRGQSFGSTPPPQLLRSFSPICVPITTKLILLRNPNRFGLKQIKTTARRLKPRRKDLPPKSCVKLVKIARRRGGRVAECGGLLNRCTG